MFGAFLFNVMCMFNVLIGYLCDLYKDWKLIKRTLMRVSVYRIINHENLYSQGSSLATQGYIYILGDEGIYKRFYTKNSKI